MYSSIEDYLTQVEFRNNPNLKPANTVIEYTDEMVAEYVKCKLDPIYFIENYVKVVHPDRGVVNMVLHEYQKRMIETYHNNRFSLGLTARQMGKCCCKDTKVVVRCKSSKQSYQLTLGEFYEWQRFIKAGGTIFGKAL